MMIADTTFASDLIRERHRGRRGPAFEFLAAPVPKFRGLLSAAVVRRNGPSRSAASCRNARAGFRPTKPGMFLPPFFCPSSRWQFVEMPAAIGYGVARRRGSRPMPSRFRPKTESAQQTMQTSVNENNISAAQVHRGADRQSAGNSTTARARKKAKGNILPCNTLIMRRLKNPPHLRRIFWSGH
jgi:hypothetical protein